MISGNHSRRNQSLTNQSNGYKTTFSKRREILVFERETEEGHSNCIPISHPPLLLIDHCNYTKLPSCPYPTELKSENWNPLNLSKNWKKKECIDFLSLDHDGEGRREESKRNRGSKRRRGRERRNWSYRVCSLSSLGMLRLFGKSSL